MKKSLLLIPSLVALSATPFVGLTSCNIGGGDTPEPTPPTPKETIDVKLTYQGEDKLYHSEEFNLENGKYYNFYWTNSASFIDNEMEFSILDSSSSQEIDCYPEEILVVVNHQEERSYTVERDRGWTLKCYVYEEEDVNIYLKCNRDINSVVGFAE